MLFICYHYFELVVNSKLRLSLNVSQSGMGAYGTFQLDPQSDIQHKYFYIIALNRDVKFCILHTKVIVKFELK